MLQVLQVRWTGAVLLAVGALASCSTGSDDEPADPPPGLESAMTDNTAAYTDVVEALEQSAPEVEWTAEGRFPLVSEQPDGRCQLFLAESLGEGDLYEPSDGLTDLAAALDPVLDEHGFDPLSEVVYPENGGDVYVTATDPAGWELKVTAYPPTVGISGPVETGRCDESILEGS